MHSGSPSATSHRTFLQNQTALNAPLEKTRQGLASLPLRFEKEPGAFQARGRGYALRVTSNGATLQLAPQKASADPVILSMEAVAGTNHARLEGEQRLPGETNYLFGNDPQQWKTKIPGYDRVRARNIYPGIDLVYYGHDRQLEYDFVVSLGADPSQIKLRFGGVQQIEVDEHGALLLHVSERNNSPAGTTSPSTRWYA
jgi:hypothetical protein